MIDTTTSRDRVRAEVFDELRKIAITMRLPPAKLARLCVRLRLDVVALREHVVREVLGR